MRVVMESEAYICVVLIGDSGKCSILVHGFGFVFVWPMLFSFVF